MLKDETYLKKLRWLFKNVIFHHQTPVILSPAFGVGGDYSQGCSWQLEKINEWKEMKADVMMNLQSRTYLLHFPLGILL